MNIAFLSAGGVLVVGVLAMLYLARAQDRAARRRHPPVE